MARDYPEGVSSSYLAIILGLEQRIHNLRMKPPIGIIKIDDERDEERKRLEELLEYNLRWIRSKRWI